MTSNPRPLIIVNHQVDPEFNPDFQFAACRLCGDVFQTALDRAGPEDSPFSRSFRTAWRQSHTAEKHSQREVDELERSGRAFTPEAAMQLAAYGVIDPVGLVMDDELAAAYREAP